MNFNIISQIEDVETIAKGQGIRILSLLEKAYGPGSWRKMKGIATIQFSNGVSVRAEIHWYEAHGIGRKDFKIKRIIS